MSATLSSSDVVETTSKPSSKLLDTYTTFLYSNKKLMFFASCILLLVCLFIGKDAFSVLKDGGFRPPVSESTRASQLIVDNMILPDYTISLVCEGLNGLTYTSSEFENYYNIVLANLKTLPIVAPISYYAYPDEKRMVSDDGTKVFMYATIAGDMPEISKFESTIESGLDKRNFRVFAGGSVIWGKEMGDEILAGVEVAEFGTLPILVVLLILALGSVMASLMAWYVALFAVFCTLTLLVGFNNVLSVSSVSASIVTMFGVGLGIDYSLIIVSRFVRDRKAFPNLHVTQIIKRTMQTSGRTVSFSAITVFLALSGGLLFHEFFLASQCMAVMIAALVAAIASNSFLFSALAWIDEGCTCCCGCGSECNGCCGLLTREKHGSGIFWCASPLENPSCVAFCSRWFNKNHLVAAGDKSDHSLVMVPQGEQQEHQQTAALELESASSAVVTAQPVDGNYKSIPLNPASPTTASTNAKEAISDEDAELQGFWYSTAEFVTKYPALILLATTCFLVAWTAYFFVSIRYGVTDPDVLPSRSNARKVYDLEHSGQFSLYGKSRVFVFLQTSDAAGVTGDAFLTSLNEFTNNLYNIHGVVPGGVHSLINTGKSSYSLADYKAMYASYAPADIKYKVGLAFPLGLTDLKKNTYVDVAFGYNAYSSEARKAMLDVRSLLKTSFKYPTTSAMAGSSMLMGPSNLPAGGVTGDPAVVYDLYQDFGAVLPAWLGILFGSTFLLLMLMTASIVIPIKAVIVSALSLGATFGIIVAMFPFGGMDIQKAFDFTPSSYIDGSNIIFVFSIAYGLSVDYELFLVSQIQEEYRKCKNTRLSIMRAMSRTGSLITSAAVMLGTTTFAFVASNCQFIKLIGVGIAVSVVIDATIVRVLLVPSVFILLDEWNWYCPGPLKRVIDWLGLEESEEHLEDLALMDGKAVGESSAREAFLDKSSGNTTAKVVDVFESRMQSSAAVDEEEKGGDADKEVGATC